MLARSFRESMPQVVRMGLSFLTHLGRWQPKAVERAPPILSEAWLGQARLVPREDHERATGG